MNKCSRLNWWVSLIINLLVIRYNLTKIAQNLNRKLLNSTRKLMMIKLKKNQIKRKWWSSRMLINNSSKKTKKQKNNWNRKIKIFKRCLMINKMNLIKWLNLNSKNKKINLIRLANWRKKTKIKTSMLNLIESVNWSKLCLRLKMQSYRIRY